MFYDNERLAPYKFSDLGGTVDIGANLSDDAQIRLGYMYTRREASVETGSPILPETSATTRV